MDFPVRRIRSAVPRLPVLNGFTLGQSSGRTFRLISTLALALILAACGGESTSSSAAGGAGGGSDDPPPDPDANKPQLTLFTATPSTVEPGSTTTLRWATTDATSCDAIHDWSGTRPPQGIEQSDALSEDSRFRLVCSGPGGQTSRTINVSVEEPPVDAPTLAMWASPTSVDMNGTSKIDWLSNHANTCVASGAWSGSLATQGSFNTPPLTATSAFNLECTGDGGSVNRSVTVSVGVPPPPPALTLTASPTVVSANGSSTLTWDSTDATSCTASGDWSGDKNLDDSESTGSLTESSTFSLDCSGPGGDVSRSVTVSVDSGDNGIPEFAQWEQNMITYGQQIAPLMDPGTYGYSSRMNHAYYDGLYVHLRIMDYTGQTEPWLTYAGWARQTWYEERYDRPNYYMSGYHRFSLGMLQDFLRGNPTASAASPAPINSPFTLQDFESITELGAFARPVEFQGDYCGSCTNMSRELAYITVAHVVSERAGLARKMHNTFGVNEARLQTYIRWIGRQMEQWRNISYAQRGYQPDTGYHQMQPFMTGLTMKALIDFYEWEVENGRDPNAYWEDPTDDNSWPTIVAALSDFTNWLFAEAVVRAQGGTPAQYVGQRLWNESAEAFRYADRYSTSEGQSPDVVSPAPDLNMLIAPAFAWVYKQTGNETARIQGDAIFAGGVRGACLSCGGKQFNQNYFYSFDYVRWRLE
ncbi:MAG: hypothetical protein QF790_09340 [Gammaproteobacteria bacterium]|jgi:hypothetical protein|nr:hypothetical protein [Gammaproteobacteria bacterium]